MEKAKMFYRFDKKTGFYVEPVYGKFDVPPDDLTDVKPPQPMDNIKWNGDQWHETGDTPESRKHKLDQVERIKNAIDAPNKA